MSLKFIHKRSLRVSSVDLGVVSCSAWAWTIEQLAVRGSKNLQRPKARNRRCTKGTQTARYQRSMAESMVYAGSASIQRSFVAQAQENG